LDDDEIDEDSIADPVDIVVGGRDLGLDRIGDGVEAAHGNVERFAWRKIDLGGRRRGPVWAVARRLEVPIQPSRIFGACHVHRRVCKPEENCCVKRVRKVFRIVRLIT